MTATNPMTTYRNRVFLKVKIKSLAEEAKAMRPMERKLIRDARRTREGALSSVSKDLYELHDEVHRHRVVDIRLEARAAQLAYAFLRGRSYGQVEQSTHQEVILQSTLVGQIVKNVTRFSAMTPVDAGHAVRSWLQPAQVDVDQVA